MNISKGSESQWKRFNKLKWYTPYGIALPHGYAGICSLLCGCHLICNSQLRSTLDVYGTIAPYLYAFFTIVNAIGGYQIAYMAPATTRNFFKASAVFQCVSCYYVIRFLPTFYTSVPYIILRMLDYVMVVPFIGVGFSFLHAAYTVRKQSPSTALATTIGTFASALTFCYPMHLVYDGHWLECILEQRYSAEDITLVAYVYIPATMCFSFMLFCATLLQRRIISDFTLGITLGICVIGTILLNVIVQEIQLPYVSGQQLYMPCPAPDVGSLSYQFEQFTDPRDFLQGLLSYPILQHIVNFVGLQPITDHETYRSFH